MNFKIDFTKREDIPKLAELDKMAFGSEVTDEVEADIRTIEEWYDVNNYQCLAAKDGEGNILGYISIYHLNNQAFDKLVKGFITEKDLTKDDFMEFKEGNRICCYIDGFTVKQSNTRIAISLINKSIAHLRFLKEKNIIIEKLGATAISKKGFKLCKKLGFEKVRDYEPLPDGLVPALYVLDFDTPSLSKVTAAIKEIILENDKYLQGL